MATSTESLEVSELLQDKAYCEEAPEDSGDAEMTQDGMDQERGSQETQCSKEVPAYAQIFLHGSRPVCAATSKEGGSKPPDHEM